MTTEEQPIPGSVFNPRQVRTLKIVVVVMSILLVIGFAFLIAGLYYQASKLGRDKTPAATSSAPVAARSGEPSELELQVAPGTKVTRVTGEGGRVIVHLRGPESEEIVILDPAQPAQFTRLKITPQ